MLRWLAGLLLLALILAGGAYVAAGRGAPPTLTIDKPDRPVGQKSELQVTAGAPAGTLISLSISLEQNGKTTPLFTLEAPESATVTQSDPTHIRVTRPFGKQDVPALQQGAARIVVSATRKSMLNLRTLSASAAKEVQVRLEPPRVSIVSTHHYVNHGGSEMVVYRASPPDVHSGVRVGDIEYAGFPAAGAGITGADPSVRVAFFALLHDQDLKTPINVFARDDAGNEARASFIDNVFEKPFRRSRIDVDDKFLGRVVPEIIEHSPELNMPPPQGDMLPGFLKVNGDLRRMNADRIVSVTANTSPTVLFKGPFVQLGNSQVEASFADHRTYIYNGKEVDQQVHLGFDLAVTARVPVHAANDGKVLNASWLGIFGNCVILDHGMGVATLYGHLSSLDVNVGDSVKKGQVLGRSGMTGMAGGDHLHFTVLVGGRPVNPVEWWDAHWIADRVERKIREASTAGAATASAAIP
jgi:murein DD-endopeptidase MepM/ murein hydrolase activator NlpD